MLWTTFCSISCEPTCDERLLDPQCPLSRLDGSLSNPVASVDSAIQWWSCWTFFHCTLIRKRGIELQSALSLANLFCFVKEDETWRKGEPRFCAIPVKIFIRFTGLGREAPWGVEKQKFSLLFAGNERGLSVSTAESYRDARTVH